MKKLLLASIFALALSGVSSAATLVNCGVCSGTTISAGFFGSDVFFNITVPRATYTGNFDNDFIKSVSINGGATQTFAFVSGPAGSTWQQQAGGLNASGCNGNGAGYCVFASNNNGADINAGNLALQTNTFTWRWTSNTALTESSVVHFKIFFSPDGTNKAGSTDLFSTDMTLGQTCISAAFCPNDTTVPEPASLSMMGAGIAGLFFLGRKYRRS